MILDSDAYSRILENLNDGLYIVDLNRTITYWNKAAEKITGYGAAEVLGKSCSDNILTHIDSSGNNLCSGMCPLSRSMADCLSCESEIYLHHKDGHRVLVSVRITPLNDADGNVIGGVELFTEISDFKHIESRIKELEDIALLDNLTRLANRHGIERELLLRIEEQKRFNLPFGILFMDVDNFKDFNDRFGHAMGDRVLKFLAETLRRSARPFDMFGRWGGEELIGLLRNVTRAQLEHTGERIRSLVSGSYILEGDTKLHVSVSVGATLVRHDDSIESLIKRADILMYQSKQAGKDRLTLG